MQDLHSLLASAPQWLCNSLRKISVPDGTPILLHGFPPKDLYIVTEGRVLISRTMPGGTVIPFFISEPWTSFGEYELLCGGDCSADVTAAADTTLLALKPKDLMRWMEEDPKVGIFFAASIAKRAMNEAEALARLAGMTVDERVLDCLLTAHRNQTLSQMTKEELCISVCAPLRSVNRSLARWRSLGLVDYRKKHLILKDPVSAAEMLAS